MRNIHVSIIPKIRQPCKMFKNRSLGYWKNFRVAFKIAWTIFINYKCNIIICRYILTHLPSQVSDSEADAIIRWISKYLQFHRGFFDILNLVISCLRFQYSSVGHREFSHSELVFRSHPRLCELYPTNSGIL